MKKIVLRITSYNVCYTKLLRGNLPYNISTSIITTFIESDFVPDNMVFTVQREMGQRMSAKTGSKNYSSFSILCQAA